MLSVNTFTHSAIPCGALRPRSGSSAVGKAAAASALQIIICGCQLQDGHAAEHCEIEERDPPGRCSILFGTTEP